MFHVGDLVCYPMHGVGVVEAIEEQTILGETAQYYRMRFTIGRMTAMVPVERAADVGLRALSDGETCEKVVGFLKTDGCSKESDNWNQRYRDNLDKLRSGDIMVVADVVKCLMRRDDLYKVSAVFHNRLRQGMKLESCATLNYITGLNRYTFSKDEMAITSAYNTYLNPGLPIGPISNPGAAAIYAALYPDEQYLEEGYLFFCNMNPNETRALVFAKTYEEHQANVDKYKQYWN